MKKFFLFAGAAVIASMFLTGFEKQSNETKSELSKLEAKFMAIDLSSGDVSYMDASPQGGWSDEYKTAKLVLRRIEPGTFAMGSPTNEIGRFDNENLHEAAVEKPFYIGVFEITQKQYQLITGRDPSEYKGDTFPVQNVSFVDIRGSEKGAAWPSNEDVDDYSFLGKLRAISKMNFDLPTEAQWEYACRAGTTSALNNGTDLTSIDKDSNLDTLGLYAGNGGLEVWKSKGPTTVGSYQPNAWGLYDMHGNVWEWCLSGKPGIRVFRGGCWRSRAGNCRAARRDGNCQGNASALYGFRVVL